MHRLDVQFSITWASTWHVGSGFAAAQADRLIQRRGGRLGEPFVPGSQLKGVLRHQVERIATSLGCEVVPPHATDVDQQVELVSHFRPLDRSRLVVDRLFGTRYQGECLYVDDAMALIRTEGTWNDHRLMARTAMDRVTGTVREKSLFVTELAEGKSRELVLHSRLRARHSDGALTTLESFPLEYSLLVAGLLSIDVLGGEKSVGKGGCQVEILEHGLRYNNEEPPLGDVLKVLATTADWKAGIDIGDEERAQ